MQRYEYEALPGPHPPPHTIFLLIAGCSLCEFSSVFLSHHALMREATFVCRARSKIRGEHLRAYPIYRPFLILSGKRQTFATITLWNFTGLGKYIADLYKSIDGKESP
jgi:hypothetical protein